MLLANPPGSRCWRSERFLPGRLVRMTPGTKPNRHAVILRDGSLALGFTVAHPFFSQALLVRLALSIGKFAPGIGPTGAGWLERIGHVDDFTRLGPPAFAGVTGTSLTSHGQGLPLEDFTRRGTSVT